MISLFIVWCVDQHSPSEPANRRLYRILVDVWSQCRATIKIPRGMSDSPRVKDAPDPVRIGGIALSRGTSGQDGDCARE